MAIRDEMTMGARFGRLSVTGSPYYVREGRNLWYVECACDCGVVKHYICKNIYRGKTVSCGCFSSQRVRPAFNASHRMSGTSTYRAWASMKTRCLNPKASHYEQYGGRGISICDRWMEFENFFSDMGERPDGKTLDRIDVNGNYEPSNCRWATDDEQMNNKQDSVYLEYQGRKLTVAQWAKETGFDRSAIDVRIKLGWSVEKILTIPPRLGRNQFG